ncbi:cupin domain-containing protein [Ramlibacter sp.]|uniref:cupin domain-containing protein n=1 Tax=Ramlibacter sp. TaxID=1917967 RepID=UPI003D0F179A
MSDTFQFVEVGGSAPRVQQQWPSIIVPRSAIEAEIERLASIPLPATGRRASAISHPRNTHEVPAFAPGIDVTIHVVKPGESTPPMARSATAVDMCIRGSGVASIGPREFGVERFDVWNTPSMDPVSYRNTGQDLFVRMSYSNAPLLEKLEVHVTESSPKPVASNESAVAEGGPRARDQAESIDIGNEGAKLLGYEYLVDIDVVPSRPLLWPWAEVEKHMANVYNRDRSYTGRHLYLLYNPATERRMGTSHCFFATIAKYPPDKVDQPHRHTSAAINYYFEGHGKSAVEGQRMEWEAGDLHFSAPGWAVHNHGSREKGFCALTIQDHPLQIAMESLIWQETLKSPIVKLGSQRGFQTNIGEMLRAA